jgi:hypothetical protein
LPTGIASSASSIPETWKRDTGSATRCSTRAAHATRGQCCRRAVVRDPLYAIARAYLGWSEVVSGDFEAGLEEERRSFRLDPTNVSTVAGKPARARGLETIQSRSARVRRSR